MGLAYPSLSQALSTAVPFTLYQQNQGGRPQWFALSLKSSGTSQITFGGYNRAKIASSGTKWFTSKLEDGTTSHTYWQIGGSTPYVNGSPALTTKVNHILDSGTTLIVASPSQAALFWAKIPNSKVYNSNYWSFVSPCPPFLPQPYLAHFLLSLPSSLPPIILDFSRILRPFIIPVLTVVPRSLVPTPPKSPSASPALPAPFSASLRKVRLFSSSSSCVRC
jgi:hypothetical protein